MESLPYDDMPDCCCKGAEDNKKLQQENTELKSQLEALQTYVLGVNDEIR